MGDWRICFTATAEKSLKRLPRGNQIRLRDAIDSLPAGDVKKLRDRRNELRLRVGDFRVVFTADFKTAEIMIIEIFHRRKGYR